MTGPLAVILMLADDLGLAESRDVALMPSLAWMRAEGRDFPNAFSMASCAPSRATLLTGLYPCRHGWTCVEGEARDERWPGLADIGAFTLPEFIQGVRCSAIGKWQFWDARRHRMDEMGWTEWLLWDQGDDPQDQRYWGGHALYTPLGASLGWSAFSEELMQSALEGELLRAALHEGPTLIFRPLLLPHLPEVQPPGQIDASRASMIRYLDELVGATMRAVHRFGLAGRTMMIFTSDNGTPGAGKGEISMDGANAPFVAWGPGLVPPGVDEQVLDFSDFVPTLCELFGHPVPEGLDGMSFLPALYGAGSGPRRRAFFMNSKPLVPTDGYLVPRDGAESERACADAKGWVDAEGVAWKRATGERASDQESDWARKMRAELAALPPDRRLALLTE